MRYPRVKFIWGAEHVIRGRWHLGLFAFYSRHGMPTDGLAISVRGLLCWAPAVAMAAYVAGATALFSIWTINPYVMLTYADALAYPLRLPAVSAKHGQAFIAQGLDLWREKRFDDAATQLRLGLARYPRDSLARWLLAEYYVRVNRRPAAVMLLQQGSAGDFPGLPYLDAIFSAFEQADDHALVVKVCDRYLPGFGGRVDSRERRWLQSRKFEALLETDRAEEALALALSEGPGDAAGEHRVRALLALGRTAAAAAYLAVWHERPGADLKRVALLQVRVLCTERRFDEMERALVELRSLDPGSPWPLAYGVVQRALACGDDAAREQLADFLFRFGGSSENLQLVATPLAEAGRVALVQRCVSAAAERGYPRRPFQVLLVDACVRSGHWAAAANALAAIPSASGRAAEASRMWCDWVRRLVDAAADPEGAAQLALLRFLRAHPWTFDVFRTSVEALQASGRLETAREAIEIGTRHFPASEWLRARNLEIELALAARKTHRQPLRGPID